MIPTSITRKMKLKDLEKTNMKFEINFKADLTPEKKELLDLHFADTLRLMGIEPEALSITLREKPEPIPAIPPEKPEPTLEELLKLPLKHIQDVKKCFEACKSKSDIAKVIKAAPAMFGTFWVEYSESYFIIVNRFFDDNIKDYYEEEYWRKYPKDWEDEE